MSKNWWLNNYAFVLMLIFGLYIVYPSLVFGAISGGGYELSGESVLPVSGNVSGSGYNVNVTLQPSVAGFSEQSGFSVISGPPVVNFLVNSLIVVSSSSTSSSTQSTNVTSTSGGGGGSSGSGSFFGQGETKNNNVQIGKASDQTMVLQKVVKDFVGDNFAYVAFETANPARVSVAYSDGEETFTTPLTDEYVLLHTIYLNGLKPGTTYSFSVYLDFKNKPPVLCQEKSYVFTTSGEATLSSATKNKSVPASPVITPDVFSDPLKSSVLVTPLATQDKLDAIQPIEFKSSKSSRNGVRLEWVLPEQEQGNAKPTFELYRSTEGYLKSPVPEFMVYSGIEKVFDDETVEKDKKYFYTLFTKDSNGKYSVGYPLTVSTSEEVSQVLDNQLVIGDGSKSGVNSNTPAIKVAVIMATVVALGALGYVKFLR